MDALHSPDVGPITNSGEGITDKVGREFALLGTGLAGIGKAAVQSVTEQPIETAGKLALSVGLGLGFAYLTRGEGMLALSAKVAGGAMGLSFGLDVLSHGRQVAGAMEDNWRSGDHWARNKAVMEESLGRFGFDTLLITAGGLAGAGFIKARGFDTNALLSPKDKVAIPTSEWHAPATQDHATLYGKKNWLSNGYQQARDSVVQFDVVRADGRVSGSGFFVDKQGRIATAQHVVDGAQEINIITTGGERIRANVLAQDKVRDVAIVEPLTVPANVAPLPLGDSQKISLHKTLALGHPNGWTEVYAARGRVIPPVLNNFAATNPDRFFVSARIVPGFSGGPILDQGGAVIGVATHKLGSGNYWDRFVSSNSTAFGARIEHVSHLLGTLG